MQNKNTTQTSISDKNSYLSIVDLAVSEPKIFLKFRRNREYREILEHVSRKQAISYLNEITTLVKFGKIYQFPSNFNEMGNPICYKFKDYGRVSPTLLRYMKVTAELEFLFGTLNEKKIIEIGGGFGGQASIIIENFEPIIYTIYDLPNVLKLQKKFLSELNLNKQIEIDFMDGVGPEEKSGDLIISNYAISEISREIQFMYLENVILKCKSGYISWNTLAEKNLGGLSLREFLEFIPAAVIIPEKPLTAIGNVIVAWGCQKLPNTAISKEDYFA